MSPKKPAPKKQPAAKKAAAKRAAPKKAAAKKAAPKKPATRADLGKPIDGFFAKQPPTLRPIVDQLRALVEAAAPDATSSLKWGMPFFEIGGEVVCAIGAHKAHVNLILSGPQGTYPDPDERLTGDGKTGRHLKILAGADVPVDATRRWLAIASDRARSAAQ